MNRRHFNKIAGLATLGLATRSIGKPASSAAAGKAKRPPVHFFSKHLQFLDYEEMSRVAAEIGFDGLDLSVRPRGHVLPENVKKDLPRAAKAMRSHGLKPTMMATGLNSADSPHAESVLKAAADEGIAYYRLSYYDFDEGLSWKANMDSVREKIGSLGALNRKVGMHGAYQNHSGSHVGSFISDIAYLLDGFDVQWLGAQYDIRHATVEGGNAWPLGLQFLKNHIRTIVVKDFRWEQRKGGLKLVNVPLGEGVVDFVRYFKLLRSHGIEPLVSLHSEYDLGGAEKGRRTLTIPEKDVIAAYKKDLETFNDLWDKSLL